MARHPQHGRTPSSVVHLDAGISRAKGRDERLGFDQLLRSLLRRRVDVVIVWPVDRRPTAPGPDHLRRVIIAGMLTTAPIVVKVITPARIGALPPICRAMT